MDKVKENSNRWLSSPRVSEEDKARIRSMSQEELDDAFFKDVELGTAGMRGVLGPGTNRMNEHTVGRVSVAFGQYLLSLGEDTKTRGIVLSHDNRFKSREFALLAAKIFNQMGIKAFIFPSLRPVPELSFAVRYCKAKGGVMITASHNPKQYNGYKIYDETGCQLVPNQANEMLRFANKLPNELEFEVPVAVQQGETIVLGEEVDDAYCKLVESCRVNPDLDKSNFKVVYTPQHGASYENAMRVFQDSGYTIIPVKEQCVHDPAFGATASPNPEVAKAWDLALEYCHKNHADLAVMTDPDGDRCGLAFLSSKGTYERFTGNQSAPLLLDYLLSSYQKQGRLPANGVLYDTIVTTSLGRVIAKSYGVSSESFLTGFKFIGHAIHQEEEKPNGKKFLFGYEESYGCLVQPFVRDKDGIQAILLYTEMALYYHNQGIPLDVAFDNLQKKYGYHVTETKDVYFEGMEGADKMKELMNRLHQNLYWEIASIPVVKIGDYLHGKTIEKDGKEEQLVGFPSSDVLKYFLEDGSTLCIRPSGTEPKMKFYIEAVGPSSDGLKDKIEAINAFVRQDAGL